MNGMNKCKYLPQQSDFTNLDTFGREGHFIMLGTENGETMAYVVDKSGQIVVTYPHYVKLVEDRMGELRQRILSEMREKVSKRRWPQTERNILEWFERYGKW